MDSEEGAVVCGCLVSGGVVSGGGDSGGSVLCSMSLHSRAGSASLAGKYVRDAVNAALSHARRTPRGPSLDVVGTVGGVTAAV